VNVLAYAVLAVSLTSPLIKNGPVVSFTACIDDRPWIPHTNPNLEKPGTMQILVDNVSRDLNVRVDIEALPWKRCLANVRAGRTDAVIGANDAPYFKQFVEFPKLVSSDTTDEARSLGTARILLVKKIDSLLEWDATSLAHLSRPVGTALGTYVMKSAVLKFGGEVDDAARTDDQNLKKLLQDRVDLVAGYEFDLQQLIQKSYKGKVTILPIPLAESHYYLAFSKEFYRLHPALVESFWNRISTFRFRPSQQSMLRDDVTATSHRSYR
jgi:polar amino acid transport system substrate-binding protein